MEPKRTSAVVTALLTALTAAALLTGCDSGTNTALPTPAATPSFPPPTTKSPARICSEITAHWVRERLAGRGTGDFMKEGLSNGTNDIVVAVMAAARKERERAGDAAAEKLITDRTTHDCTERYRNGTPTGNPWH
ncbi:hypothetical protein ACFYVL_24335 [Streptomyces sp. NPDC004111]|uniref:hypothetical protein n=1 Tax=Streptomyces sp. NPDC004111 TaxID=3364690 RepID=UPI00367533DD